MANQREKTKEQRILAEKALLKKLNLPEHMSANAMLQALNLLYTREELEQMLNESGIERD